MSGTPEIVGSVAALWHYPIKSMQGETLESAILGTHGLLGDRVYAIQECDTGHIASAKHPRKWAKLLACRATFENPPQPQAPLPPVLITLPDGTMVSSAQSNIDQVLSQFLGRAVTLIAEAPSDPTREANRTPIDPTDSAEIIRQEALAAAAPSGTFFDHATIHMLTTATLAHLQELYPEEQVAAVRFRCNILVNTGERLHSFVENRWLAHTLSVGSSVELDVIDPCPRCVVTTLAQGAVPHDPQILRTVSQHNAVASVTAAPGVVLPAIAGVYAQVKRDGMLAIGDALRIGV